MRAASVGSTRLVRWIEYQPDMSDPSVSSISYFYNSNLIEFCALQYNFIIIK